MTIAVCHVSPEGVVFGADSTSSCITDDPAGHAGGYHYFNNEQKIFEVGENSCLGIATWGLGSVGTTSHRTLIAKLADSLKAKKASSVKEAAERWATVFWKEYSKWLNSPQCGFGALKAKAAYDANNPADPSTRTVDEERRFQTLATRLYVGFALGGYIGADREPKAYSVEFKPLASAAPPPLELSVHSTQFWGVPNIILRLLRGYDDNLLGSILASGKWGGSRDELVAALAKQQLIPGHLPIRDAIDYVHTCVSSTIKALKFSSLAQVCGGPVELAVITTDRRFRWVKHKPWDAGIEEGNSQ